MRRGTGAIIPREDVRDSQKERGSLCAYPNETYVEGGYHVV